MRNVTNALLVTATVNPINSDRRCYSIQPEFVLFNLMVPNQSWVSVLIRCCTPVSRYLQVVTLKDKCLGKLYDPLVLDTRYLRGSNLQPIVSQQPAGRPEVQGRGPNAMCCALRVISSRTTWNPPLLTPVVTTVTRSHGSAPVDINASDKDVLFCYMLYLINLFEL